MPTPATVKCSRIQKGAALVVSMVMLLVITVIGVAVMSGSHLEWLMANNTHLQTDAYRNAEIALAKGLSPGSIPNPPTPDPATTPFTMAVSPLTPQTLADISKWSDGTITTTVSVPTPTGSGAYVMQYLGCSEYIYSPPSTYLQWTSTGGGPCNSSTNIIAYTFRVWALGTDGKGATRLLQTTRTLIDNQPAYSSLPSVLPSGLLPALDNRVELPSS